MQHRTKKGEEEKYRKAWAKVVARAWDDELFKHKLLHSPKEALKEYGLTVPEGTALKILEETARSQYLILPRRPQGELSDEELKSVAAGESTISSCRIFLQDK